MMIKYMIYFRVDKETTKNNDKEYNSELCDICSYAYVNIYIDSHTVIMKYNKYRVTDPKVCQKLFTKQSK